MLRSLLVLLLTLISATGCGSRPEPTFTHVPLPDPPETSTVPGATIERVRTIVAEQLGVPRTKVQATTTFGDLGVDDLDFVELIMELEEAFSITISDEKAEALAPAKDGPIAMNKITIEKLAAFVDQCRK